MRRLSPDSVVYCKDVSAPALNPCRDGACYFLRKGGCQVHAKHGAAAKPAGCRRFPYGLVGTPMGGRITTEHRCPCRTLGARPEINLEDADASLRDRAGRLEAENRMEGRLRLTRRSAVSFARYVALEARLLERLNSGERAESVLRAAPLPKLDGRTWPGIATDYFDMQDGTAGGHAVAWFGDALLSISAGHSPPQRPRPWRAAFERAASRPGGPLDPELIYNDWVADELWQFRASDWGPFDVARAELATRLAVARRLSQWLELQEVAPRQAAAEAIMMVEIATVTSVWPEAAQAIAQDPSPAEPLEP